MIKVEDLRFRYHHQESDALDGLSLEISEGALALVSGPTGCGKSTLGLALAGAIPHAIRGTLSGTIRIGEADPAAIPLRHLARQVGLLLQNVECQMVTDRVEDEVAFGLENLALNPRDMPPVIDRALHTVQAEHLRGRLLTSLSAGERQRVMLAAMLSLGQQVLILDEPLAYLDRQATASLLSLVTALSRQGKTVVIMEHRRQAILPAARQEICINRGRLADKPVPRVDLPPLAETSVSGESLLAFENVSFGWREGFLVLHDLSFEIKAGESYVLLGDNGAGKTTLLKL
ncbi:MAG: ABC transporter ATP-binding protein, partial [Desulfobaccales bacterium]